MCIMYDVWKCVIIILICNIINNVCVILILM